MEDQIIGALITVSTLSVGALAWVVRNRKANGDNTHRDRRDFIEAFHENTTLLRELTALMRQHTAEAALRHQILEKALERMERQGS